MKVNPWVWSLRSTSVKQAGKLFIVILLAFYVISDRSITDMVAGTFVGTGVEGMTDATSYANSAAASISMLFIVVAVIFGVIQKHLGSRMNEVIKAIVAIVLLVVMFIIGMKFPICTTKNCMDLHRNGLPVLSICLVTNVAFNAA